MKNMDTKNVYNVRNIWHRKSGIENAKAIM